MQGTLLFVGLLLLLWVPLLVFSSGNPTYQIPMILTFHTNATLTSYSPAGSNGWSSSRGSSSLGSHTGRSTALRQSPPGWQLHDGSQSGSGAVTAQAATARQLRSTGVRDDGPPAAARSAVQFQLFAGGDRRAFGPWAGGTNGSLPAGLTDYDPSQLQLLCVSPVSFLCVCVGRGGGGDSHLLPVWRLLELVVDCRQQTPIAAV